MRGFLDDAAGCAVQFVLSLCKICQGHSCVDLLPIGFIFAWSLSISCTRIKQQWRFMFTGIITIWSSSKKVLPWTGGEQVKKVLSKLSWKPPPSYLSPLLLPISVFFDAFVQPSITSPSILTPSVSPTLYNPVQQALRSWQRWGWGKPANHFLQSAVQLAAATDGQTELRNTIARFLQS